MPSALVKDFAVVVELFQIVQQIRFGTPHVDHIERKQGRTQCRPGKDAYHKMGVFQNISFGMS